MQTILILIQLFVSIALIVVVLLQKSEGGAFGMGGSGSGTGLFSPRGAGNALTRTTAVLGVMFFITSIALTLLALNSGGRQGSSILDSAHPAPVSAPKPVPAPAAPPAPAVPSVPRPGQ